ncbi:hypothetical protein L2E82_00197 [Cichorium intybus]|uniref:Uncharacterized protein n=1 Tax=Cichorium intybus TaxID=13427 RepID=A0ACB9GWE0_CICIN|nr:hypothetical protein L2E82_00197 [Cichorium intybus]
MLFRFSCPHTSSQNGKAERKIRSINNVIRTLLSHSSVPPSFWHHALQMATYLLNILPAKTKNYLTPTSLLYSKHPSYNHLRTFGCLCFPLTPSSSVNKLENRSSPCVFLGYPSNHRGYKCYNLSTRKITISRHVVFDESVFPFKSSSTPTPSYSFLQSDPHPSLWSSAAPPVTPTSSPPADNTPATPSRPPLLWTYSRRPKPTHQSADQQPHVSPSPTTSEKGPNPPPPPPPSRTIQTRSMSGISKPSRQLNLHTNTSPEPIPKTPAAALSSPAWNQAMRDEFNAIIANETWELVPRQPNMNVIRCMWIFKHKLTSDGHLERYKARLVCDGRSQQVGVDCGDTFSPVVKPATIRIVLTLALAHSWQIHQLDVQNAFLHGNLVETVYMHQPYGFRDPSHPDHVCRLRKSLYGLKQSPRAWYQRFTDFVSSMGFNHSQCDHSLFIYRKGDDMAFILLYVDDILLITSSDTLRTTIMRQLAQEFAMKDLGRLSHFLGISVTHNPDGLFLSQQKYASDIIERAGLSSCKPAQTPVDVNGKLSATEGDPMDNPTLYRSLAGALQYLTFTRPDITYAVQQVCMFMHAPRTPHFNALKRILRYVQGTLSFGLHMTRPTSLSLIGYTDADWAGCPDTRRSTSGYCLYLGDNLISWSSKRQTTISRSSAEAEYRGVANIVSELCWVRNLLLELHHPPLKASIVYCDNVSAIYLSGNPIQHQRTKHVEIDIHFVREKVRQGQVRVLHVSSRFQIADIFTKGLPRVLFEDFRSSLNLRSPPAMTAGV